MIEISKNMPESLTQTLKEIHSLITQYTKSGDNMNPAQLLKMQDDLSGHYYFLSQHVAIGNLEANVAYYNRKITQADNYNKLKKSGEELKTKLTRQDITNQIEYETMEQTRDQLQKQYFRDRLMNLLGALNHILRAINQRISTLNKEQKYGAK